MKAQGHRAAATAQGDIPLSPIYQEIQGRLAADRTMAHMRVSGPDKTLLGMDLTRSEGDRDRGVDVM